MKRANQHRNGAHPYASPVIKFKLYSWGISEMINSQDTYQRRILHNAIPAS